MRVIPLYAINWASAIYRPISGDRSTPVITFHYLCDASRIEFLGRSFRTSFSSVVFRSPSQTPFIPKRVIRAQDELHRAQITSHERDAFMNSTTLLRIFDEFCNGIRRILVSRWIGCTSERLLSRFTFKDQLSISARSELQGETRRQRESVFGTWNL